MNKNILLSIVLLGFIVFASVLMGGLLWMRAVDVFYIPVVSPLLAIVIVTVAYLFAANLIKTIDKRPA